MSISVKAEIARKNCRYVNIAKKIKMSPSTFYKKLEANKFSIEETENIFSVIGIKLIIREK
jgi:hypothetical protein